MPKIFNQEEWFSEEEEEEVEGGSIDGELLVIAVVWLVEDWKKEEMNFF